MSTDSRGRPRLHARPHYGEDQVTGAAMLPAEIAKALGCTKWNVAKLLRLAMGKLRRQKRRKATQRFREAVEWKRQWLNARKPNRPWFDIDAEA